MQVPVALVDQALVRARERQQGDGWTLTPHVGYQKIKGPVDSVGTYTDYSLGVSKDFSGLVLSAAVVGAETKKIADLAAAQLNHAVVRLTPHSQVL